MLAAPIDSTATPPRRWRPVTWLAILTALTVITFLIHGYHPLADDGGLSVAGIEYKLDPTLFPHYTPFVTEHLRFSLFAPTLAIIARLTHLQLAWILLLVDLLTIVLTFYAARRILQHCVDDQSAQLAALCLLSAFWTLPIAGTSLFLMDPYLTARSFSTPLSLLAISFALDPRLPSTPLGKGHRLSPHFSCGVCLFVAALFHPLMAAYAAAFVLALHLTRLQTPRLGGITLLLAATILAATLQLFAPHESPALIAAELSRDYWFLSQWRWFEFLGLAGPLIVFALLLRWLRKRPSAFNRSAANLYRASLATGLTAIVVALLFAHRDGPTHLVALLQPLRSFLLMYAIMTLFLGATIFQFLRNRPKPFGSPFTRRTTVILPALTFLALATTMFSVQRLNFPTSPHLELPWSTSSTHNPWVRAFLWARDNTPKDALFALDAKYISEPGEEAQTFRATSYRSALPDYFKDGGEAAIAPSLAASWQQSSSAQIDLSTETDLLRDSRLLPLGVTWIVLRSTAITRHPCPYDNGAIKVCRLQPQL